MIFKRKIPKKADNYNFSIIVSPQTIENILPPIASIRFS